MSDPSITVYVLAYNRPDYLQECLQSISKQTLRNFNVVVIDDCSPIDLKPVVARNAQPVEYQRNPINLRLFGNFCHAWREAKKTPYFVIFHDDDLMHPEFLERSLAMIRHPSRPAWAGSSSLDFSGNAPAFPTLANDPPIYLNAASLAHGLMTRRLKVTHSSAIYRSDLTTSIDLELLIGQHHIVADRPIFFALAEQQGCVLSSLPLILYRYHPSQSIKVSPLSENNLLALFTTYRRTLQPIWGKTVERDFYRWSGFHIPDGYWRLAPTKRSSFRKYLGKAREMDVYRDRFLSRFVWGSVKANLSRFSRISQKILKWVQSRWQPPRPASAKPSAMINTKFVKRYIRITNIISSLGWPAACVYLWQTARVRLLKNTKTFALVSKKFRYPLHCRHQTSDKMVFSQIFIEEQYTFLNHLSLPEPKLIIDCGANVGYSSVWFLNRFPFCKVVSIEPDPDNFRLLKKNLLPYKDRVTLIQAAVWSHNTNLKFNKKTCDQGSEWSIQVRECLFGESADLIAHDIQTVLEAVGQKKISILKMDIEGSEAVVFSKNYESWLPHVGIILVELHDQNTLGDSSRTVLRAASSIKHFDIFHFGELTVLKF